MPYPAPLTSLDEHRDLYKNPDRRRAQFHLMWPTEPLRGNQEILVAGCGTSQAARYALREPEARITAIDISETSLVTRASSSRNIDLENLELQQLPIENVGELGRTFDQVVCTGVLHHLPDPDVGLRALRDVLRPQGAMHLMVYALYGRTGIYMMQEYCRLLGITTSDDGPARASATTLQKLPATHPIAGVMRGAMDFNHPDALADALLHPSDRAYTVPQLYAWLERCGMSFGRWVEQAPYLPQCGMVAKTPHAARLAALPAPRQHAAVELLRGTMFRHNLIAYRDDRSGASQPITFRGDRLAHVRSDRRAMDRVRSRTRAAGQRRRVDQPGACVHRSRAHRRCVRGPAARCHRWPANAGRDSVCGRWRSRRGPGAAFLREAVAVRSGRLRRVAPRHSRRSRSMSTTSEFARSRSKRIRLPSGAMSKSRISKPDRNSVI